MITVKCWGHVDPAKRHYTAEYTETHSFTATQAAWLLEQMSEGDWEDGPRCLRELVNSMPPKHSVEPGGYRTLPRPEPEVYIPGTKPGPARHVVLGEVADRECRVMQTRDCPPSYGLQGCGTRPCARFQSEDETPWLDDAGTGGPC